MSPLLLRHLPLLAVLATSLAVSACMGSNTPLLGADSRVLPFLSPATFDVYERGKPDEPWTKQNERQTLTADRDLIVSNDTLPNDRITFHPFGPQRYLVQYEMQKAERIRYRYAVLDVANGEGLFHMTMCETLDQNAFKAAGGSIIPDQYDPICNLDTAKNPLELLRTFAANPVGSQFRYVPVR
jgi:hypothetical protein